ncbi:phosphatidylinositol transfer protein csr1 [Coemansia sp. RSA 989]|nr:CRAL-TRIO domain-containing protein [Coemansia mojavensis]KAJ1742781.1 phosphatidylinositol transfer protein csr1 [Coemansia sp. RSA 1086]KAJ1752230.1 phosphatidylinositol transfer protein csr1 [Coemansia sp. RSA 1821]KAJ1867373.1 phosphatidylinositol transfer protein csr1 [Coemansia sp. RSA 989]KAJ1873781.1 phosphatidylinositol transfer protein csr1 [Coemansia sp. RSA 990]KAJ2649282.1 phosphatidylinositol transfer protein csr1 [Coemansia sp. RSA 1250]KAJ2671989.1 phosphatidylinositol tran
MSGLLKAISRQRSQVDIAGAGRESITTQFTKGRLDTCGVFGNLTKLEETHLAQLWERLLADFDKPLDEVTSDPIIRPIEYDEEADSKRAKETQETSPFEVFQGCMFNETVADKCKELGIVSEMGKDGELVPPFESQLKDKTLKSAFWQAVREDHPDVLMLRFLRARKWDVEKAYKMAIAAVKWRVQEKVDEIIWYGDIHNDASLMWKGVSYAHGKDRLGQPIIWSGSCLHHQKDQSYPQLKRYLIWMMETLRQLLFTPIERVCLIMDLTDHSNANMDWPFVKTFIKFLEAYYPECLGICIVYNGPWWFSGVWKLISPLLDPVVASKVQFAQKPEGLLKFIDEKELLAIRGGKDKYVYEYVKPQPEENKLMFDKEGREKATKKLDEKRELFVEATREWVDAKGGDGFAEMSGKRRELSNEVRQAAEEKDKYTRARHFYTRAGVLENGVVDWSRVQEYD